jgi:hypothetical protein
MSDLIRYRYNNKCAETPGGEWKWRVLLENGNGFTEVLAKRMVVQPPSFSIEDNLPDVGPKCHMACRGRFKLREDGIGVIE